MSKRIHENFTRIIARFAMGLCMVAITPVLAKEVVVSEIPVDIRIPVEKEFIIKFPGALTHANVLNPEAAANIDQMLTPDGVLYITPAAEIEKARMVAEMVSGKLIMLDITASRAGPWDSSLTLVEHTLPSKNTRQQPTVSEPAGSSAAPRLQPHAETSAAGDKERNPYKPEFLEDGKAKTLEGETAGSHRRAPGYHDMVRYGFRHYVGPARLIGDDLGTPVKLGKSEIGNKLIRMNGGKLSVKPLRSWEIDGLYLTVLLVNNTSSERVDFDPRAIRGRFIFAAALYPVLEPSGSKYDQTLWALISEVPFAKTTR